MQVAAAAGRARLAVLARRHAGVHERALEIGAVLHLELVQAARATAGAQTAELGGLSRVGDVEDLQAAEDARVGAVAATDLDADDRDVAPGERPVARGVRPRRPPPMCPAGSASFATARGSAGLRVSTTATPSFGQNRCLEPDAQSEKPHEPT